MEKLLEALRALERLGTSWKARRVSKKFLFDTIECTALVQTDEGVFRGFVEVQRWDIYCRAKMEVACFLGGKLEAPDKFKHAKHPKNKTVKIAEYENVLLYRYSRVFGISLGFKPIGAVPAEHQFLVEFVKSRVAKFDAARDVANDETTATAEEQRRENNEKARRALFM